MNIDFLDSILSSFIVFKIGLLVLILFNLVLLFFIFIQINSMNRIISHVYASSFLVIVSLLAIAFSFSLFLAALVIL